MALRHHYSVGGINSFRSCFNKWTDRRSLLIITRRRKLNKALQTFKMLLNNKKVLALKNTTSSRNISAQKPHLV